MTSNLYFIILLFQVLKTVNGSKWVEYPEHFKLYYEENWRVDDKIVDDKIQIYGAWPISDTYDILFYGDYRGLTIVGDNHLARFYKIIPSANNYVWNNNRIYFVASYMLCRHGNSEELNWISWYDMKESILSIKLSNSYSFSVFHIFIKTLLLEYLCNFQRTNWISTSSGQFKKISSIVTLSNDKYIISGFNQPLCNILVDSLTSKLIYFCNTDYIGKGQIIKSGGTYDKIKDILYKIEQTDRIYLIQYEVSNSPRVTNVSRMKTEMGEWLFSGFSEVRDSRLYTFFKWDTKSIIMIHSNFDYPIAFFTNSEFDYIPWLSKDRFFILALSKNSSDVIFSNAPFDSINSVVGFRLIDYTPMNIIDRFNISYSDSNSTFARFIFNPVQINQTFNATITRVQSNKYSNINFRLDSCIISRKLYNQKSILLDEIDWRFIWSSDNELMYYRIRCCPVPPFV